MCSSEVVSTIFQSSLVYFPERGGGGGGGGDRQENSFLALDKPN